MGPVVFAPVNNSTQKKEKQNREIFKRKSWKIKSKKKGKLVIASTQFLSTLNSVWLISNERPRIYKNQRRERREPSPFFPPLRPLSVARRTRRTIGELRSSEKRCRFQLLRSIHLTDKRISFSGHERKWTAGRLGDGGNITTLPLS
jgi:hypothetical protein